MAFDHFPRCIAFEVFEDTGDDKRHTASLSLGDLYHVYQGHFQPGLPEGIDLPEVFLVAEIFVYTFRDLFTDLFSLYQLSALPAARASMILKCWASFFATVSPTYRIPMAYNTRSKGTSRELRFPAGSLHRFFLAGMTLGFLPAP